MFLKKHCNSAFIPAESISQLFLELNLYSFVLKKTKNWYFQKILSRNSVPDFFTYIEEIFIMIIPGHVLEFLSNARESYS